MKPEVILSTIKEISSSNNTPQTPGQRIMKQEEEPQQIEKVVRKKYNPAEHQKQLAS